MAIQIEAPNLAVSGASEEIDIQQQVQGGLTDGIGGIRFSNSAQGPFVTAQGNAGPVRAELGPWSAQEVEFGWDVTFYENVWVQFAVWGPTQDPHGEAPMIVSDNVERVKVVSNREA